MERMPQSATGVRPGTDILTRLQQKHFKFTQLSFVQKSPSDLYSIYSQCPANSKENDLQMSKLRFTLIYIDDVVQCRKRRTPGGVRTSGARYRSSSLTKQEAHRPSISADTAQWRSTPGIDPGRSRSTILYWKNTTPVSIIPYLESSPGSHPSWGSIYCFTVSVRPSPSCMCPPGCVR